MGTSVANASFCWEDPLLLDSQLAADERIVRNAAHDYAQKKLRPRIRDAFRHEQMDAGIFREIRLRVAVDLPDHQNGH